MSGMLKFKKLSRMSWREIRWRLQSVQNQRRERRFWLRQREAGPAVANSVDFRKLLNRCRKLVPGGGAALRESVSAELPGQWAAVRQISADRAKAIVDGGWVSLGHSWDLRGDIQWDVDPRTGYRWKPLYYGDLPLYNLPGDADVKYPWELSRHQFLFSLACNHSLNNCKSSRVRVREVILDWIRMNPVYEGVNWTSGLEVALRSQSWILSLALLADWEGWQPGDGDCITQSLSEHAAYLHHHLSFYSSPYNHLIGEATALYLLSELLDEHPLASNWHRRATRVLAEHGGRQFYQDGFCVEQAVSYHYFTLGFLLLALVAARRFGRPLAKLEPVIHRALRAGMAFRRPDGRWPAIGDLDSARALPIAPEDFWKFDGLNACGAVLFEDSQLIGPGAEPGEELYWMFGNEGITAWESLKPSHDAHQAVATPVSSVSQRCREEQQDLEAKRAAGGAMAERFERRGPLTPRGEIQCVMHDAGYVIASDGNDWMLFDAGPIAAGLFADATPSTAHGHADTLQVLYFAEGQMVLDDGGIPFYNGDSEWIRHFRSPQAHNTVEIEGCELVRSEGRLAWSREVRRPTLTAELSDDVWLCSGRLQWLGVTWERSLLCLPGTGLWIADWIETARPRQVTWHWQLPARAAVIGDRVIGFADQDLRRVASRGVWESSLITSQSDRPEGLRCHGYGEKSPGAVLVQSQQVDRSLLVLTSIGRKGRQALAVHWHDQSAGSSVRQAESSLWRHGDCRWAAGEAGGQLVVQATGHSCFSDGGQ